MDKSEASDKVILRPATNVDIDFARDVHHQAFHDVVVAQFGEWDETKQDGFFDRTWASPGLQIVNYGEQSCGYWRVEELSDSIEAHELALLPAFQGKGIGTALLHKYQERATEQGVPICLQVLRTNRATKLYARAGFKPVGQTDTHIKMEWWPKR